LTKRLVERAMEVELTNHLGYKPHQEPPGGAGNTRNGSTPKRLITEHGEVQIDTPCDRAGSFDPQIVRKRQRRFEGFDDKILALYARGLSTRDIEAHLAEIDGVKVGRDLISRVTDAVMDDARARQTPAAGGRLPGGVPGCAGPQDPRRRDGPAPRVLPGDGDHDGW
jgi:putative transposase